MTFTLPFAASKVALGLTAGLSLAAVGTAASLAGGPPGAPSAAQTVQTCKAAWKSGDDGAGPCVSLAEEPSPSPSPSEATSSVSVPSAAPSATPFGQLVKGRVKTCKQAAAAAGAHGIGACVSIFASSHGANTTIPTFTTHGPSAHGADGSPTGPGGSDSSSD